MQERKLQDLEVELETRAKEVKAWLAQLDVQVRERGWRFPQVPLTLETWFPQERNGLSAPVPWGLEVAEALVPSLKRRLPQGEAAVGQKQQVAWTSHLASLSPPPSLSHPHLLFTGSLQSLGLFHQ